ncbi:hypothetical protein [Pseudoduganella violaceinigra]|uniref:hypothetical protein n=1 Tax=Pseudoduganella violaceinigra TaxID=246602 RepID=UPI001E482D89|nr:hypothetical protein [Pseudoduganella violaceinigra]
MILLTVRNELDDRLQGLNLGADDYQRLRKKLALPEQVAIEAMRGVGHRLRKPDDDV